MQSPETPLVGFSGQILWPLGVISLPLTLFDYKGRGIKTVIMNFMVVRAPLPYNVILGRPGMRRLGAIASTIHLLIKFPIPSSISIVRGDAPYQEECLQVSRMLIKIMHKNVINIFRYPYVLTITKCNNIKRKIIT
jgi:hypothetical protein